MWSATLLLVACMLLLICRSPVTPLQGKNRSSIPVCSHCGQVRFKFLDQLGLSTFMCRALEE